MVYILKGLKITVLTLVLSIAISLCFVPYKVKATDYSVHNEGVCQEGCCIEIPESIENASEAPHPVCDHHSPMSGLYPNTTMRFIRRVDFPNPMTGEYDIQMWYQCFICGYQTFWIYGHYPQ